MRKSLLLASGIALVGLGVLTATRFVDTGIAWPILMASFSSYAILGFLVVLLGCVLAVRTARRRRLVVLIGVLAAVGLAVQGWWLAPLYDGGASGKPDVTVMTLNMQFGRADAATVVRAVAANRVDVLVLEEATPTALNNLAAAGLGDLLPNRSGTAGGGAKGTMAFSSYQLGPETPFAIGNGGLDVRVEAPEPFRLLALHTVQPVVGSSSWLRDLQAIRQRASSVGGEGPTMVVGDFNATRDHEPFRAILHAGLRDAAEESGSGWQPTWPSPSSKRWLPPVITIDHVLVSDQFQAISTSTVEVPGTDHLALVANLQLRSRD